MAKSLTERLQAALAPNARASDVSQLIGLIADQIEAAKAEQARLHAIAIDAGSDDATADDAADAEVKAARRVTRLEGQYAQLSDRLAELKAADERRAYEAHQAEVLAERDALAADLRREWPLIEAKIQHLLWRIVISDKRCGSSLASAEAVARGCGGAFNFLGMPVHRLIELKIPGFDVAGSAFHAAWPPDRREYDRVLWDAVAAKDKIAETRAIIAHIESGDAD